MKPLQGRRILITRGVSQARKFSKLIESKGGVAIETPLLAFQLYDSDHNRKILHQLHDYSWVFLTSSNGVKFFFELLKKTGSPLPDHLQFAIIGEKTERLLNDHGSKADFLPSSYHATTMGKEFFLDHPQPGKILYIRGNRSRDALPRFFENQGAFFQSMTLYDTLLVKDDQDKIKEWLSKGFLDALTFTSPSTVHAYMSIVRNIAKKGLNLPCFCIGPTTGETAQRYGFQYVNVPEKYTIDHMSEQIENYFSNERKR